MEFYVISFESTHHAIMVEKKLKEKHKIDMIPTPREITASCGLSIKFSPELYQQILEDLKEIDISGKEIGLYLIERKNNTKIVKKIERED